MIMLQKPDSTPPGIVVFSSSLHLLHMNQRAIHLLAEWQGSAPGSEVNPNLAARLHPYGQDMVEAMQECLASNNWQPFHRYHAIGDPGRQLLLKGFGLPDRRGLSYSRIVLTLTPHNPVLVFGQGKPEPLGASFQQE